jgi:hypothetical protein
MGTKADFYLGNGTDACWLGSIAWDGHPWKIPMNISQAKSEEDYRLAVEEFLSSRQDASHGEGSWPWPWVNSHRTHYSYTFDDGKIKLSHFGGPWIDPSDPQGWEFPTSPKQDFPDMSNRMLSIIGERSGLVVVRDPVIARISPTSTESDDICS